LSIVPSCAPEMITDRSDGVDSDRSLHFRLEQEPKSIL